MPLSPKFETTEMPLSPKFETTEMGGMVKRPKRKNLSDEVLVDYMYQNEAGG